MSRTVNSVDHALRLIARLADCPEPQNVADLARALELPRPTVYRLLATLIEHRMVVRDATRYRLGLRLLELGGSALGAANLDAAAQPHLRELAGRTGETAHFAVLDGKEVCYVSKVDGGHPIRMLSHVGWRGPLHATAVGKVLLAWSGPDLLEQVIQEERVAHTARTLVDPARLRQEVEKTRVAGWAVDDQELLDGLVCLAAPVLAGSRLVGAMSVSGPAARMAERTAMLELVVAAAREMGAAM
ncbi:MAG: IclR family transcriptional regulator [Burkholderiaceae bacterium]